MIRTVLALLALATPAAATDAFPVQVTPEFDLIDHTGTARTQEDFADRAMVIFFGYANCESICMVALPSLGHALDALGEDLDRIHPILITIDPRNDTPEALAKALPIYHPALIGLTGEDADLEAARRNFNVEVEEIFQAPDGSPVYAHGSFIYMIGSDGELKTLMPPILSPERMAELIRKYL